MPETIKKKIKKKSEKSSVGWMPSNKKVRNINLKQMPKDLSSKN